MKTAFKMHIFIVYEDGYEKLDDIKQFNSLYLRAKYMRALRDKYAETFRSTISFQPMKMRELMQHIDNGGYLPKRD